jgi:diketogulonate reductase-like aldo/keto reductase
MNPNSPNPKRSLSRRATLQMLGFGAASTALPAVFQSFSASQVQGRPAPILQTGQLITKQIPRTQEQIPAVGLGTFMTFDVPAEQNRAPLQEVFRRFVEAGGRMIDVSPLYGLSEVNVGEFANALGGINKDLFIANKIWATGEFLGDRAQATRQLEQSLQRLSRDRIDAMQVHSLVNVDVIVPLLRAWKKEGRIRYLGVTHHEPIYFGAIERWIERGDLDFVQVRYSIAQRQAEERLLRAAAEQGTAVLANMPFEKARLFEFVKGQQLPDFAREIGCENWAQFFLKYVISHPAVTAAIPATTNPEHLTQNMGALRGPLPDEAMRIRMVKHMESLAGFDKLIQTSWYPGKQFSGLVRLPNPFPVG